MAIAKHFSDVRKIKRAIARLFQNIAKFIKKLSLKNDERWITANEDPGAIAYTI